MKKVLLVFMSMFLVFSAMAEDKDQEYVIDSDGNIVFTRIIEDMPMNKAELHEAAYQYISTAYRDTKYKVTKNSAEDGIVVGEGEFIHFHEANYYPSSYFLNAPIVLRADAKDGRIRLTVTLSHYTGTRTNVNKREEIHDRISECPPISKIDKGEKLYDRRKKLYEKAFVVLSEKVKKTLGEFEEALKAARSTAVDDNW